MGKKSGGKREKHDGSKNSAHDGTALSQVPDGTAETRPSKAGAKNGKDFDLILRKEALQSAVEKLTKTGETFLDMESMFASLSTQKLAVRKHIREIRDDFDQTKAALECKAYDAPDGIPKIKAMQRLTEAQFSYCCELSNTLQESQCKEFDILTSHMSEAMKAMHDSMLITMQLVQAHVEQAKLEASEGKTSLLQRLDNLEKEVSALRTHTPPFFTVTDSNDTRSGSRGRSSGRTRVVETDTCSLPTRPISIREASEERLAFARATGNTGAMIGAAQEIAAFNRGVDKLPAWNWVHALGSPH
jgi:hypothetical protein